MKGSIALARQLCYEIAGATSEDDIDGGGYGSVDIAEILSAEVVRLQAALAQPEQQAELVAWNAGVPPMWPQQKEGETFSVAYIAQPEQEPVAYLCENGVGHRYFRWKKPSDIDKPISLYTAPPQREWVGLTDEEMSDIVADIDVDFGDLLWKVVCLTKIIEATLKERNK